MQDVFMEAFMDEIVKVGGFMSGLKKGLRSLNEAAGEAAHKSETLKALNAYSKGQQVVLNDAANRVYKNIANKFYGQGSKALGSDVQRLSEWGTPRAVSAIKRGGSRMSDMINRFRKNEFVR